jgi:succinoglycan biosynthesis transport protein ExoP
MDSETLGSRFRGLFRNTTQALGFPKETAEDQSIHYRNDPEKIAFDSVVRNLTVSREDVASVLTVALSSKDTVKAATIVNAIVDTYINESIADKMKTTNVVGQVVQERVEELKRQAKDAESALLEYKMANHLVGTAKATLSGEQIATLQTHLTNARVAMAEAKARMEWNASDPDASALFAPDNGLISKLRSDLLDLSVRANDIESRVGKDHLADQVPQPYGGVREGLPVSRSASRDRSTKTTSFCTRSIANFLPISRVMGEEGANSDVQARVRELESAADSFRTSTIGWQRPAR